MKELQIPQKRIPPEQIKAIEIITKIGSILEEVSCNGEEMSLIGTAVEIYKLCHDREDAEIADNMRDFWKNQQAGSE